jgi:competence protein ComFB
MERFYMDIHNISEDNVITAVKEIFDAVKKQGNPDKLCLCEQCKLDTICYTLNRIEPRYFVSNRGLTRVDRDGSERHQAHADITALVYKGLKQVNHNLRPTAAHDGTLPESIVGKLSFDIPTIVGRLFDGETFAPVSGVTVRLFCNNEVVPMRNTNWQNPYTLVANTPGAYTFWPAPVPAAMVDTHQIFEYSIVIESDRYDPLHHFFKIPAVSTFQSEHSYFTNRTFKLPDLYLFSPGEAEQNGE